VVRHAIASVFSNGIWFTSQMLIFKVMYSMMTGQQGRKLQFMAAAFYTTFTVVGALVGHYFSLRTEKGKSAVGASKKYAQITIEEWDTVKSSLTQRFIEEHVPMTNDAEYAKKNYVAGVWPTPPIPSSYEGGNSVRCT
jgi:hypothetical protein